MEFDKLTAYEMFGSNPAELPLLLTVEEAAKVLRIGLSAAYQSAGLFRSSNGSEGLPVIAIGRHLRVPREGLIKFITP
jgi:hypothetical protein